MNAGKNNRAAKGKALRRISIVSVLLIVLLVVSLFVVGGLPGKTGGGDTKTAAKPDLDAATASVTNSVSPAVPPGSDPSVAPPPGGSSGDNDATSLNLRTPDSGKDIATGTTLADGQQVQVRFDEDTGTPAFLTGPVSPPPAGSTQQSAMAFLDANRQLFRVKDAASEFSLHRDNSDKLGMQHLEFDQMYQGVPVFGAQTTFHFTGSGQISSINGHYVPDIDLSVNPDVSVADAAATALDDFGTGADYSKREFPQLVVLPLQGKAPVLAWKITLSNDDPPVRMVYFINAHTGAIAARYNALEEAKNRKTYTANNGTSLPGTLLISEGGSSPDGVAQATHNNTGYTYDYYWNTFGRDSFNGNGATITSSVHYSQSYNNAFWNGYQMVYGDGDGSTFSPLGEGLDVVAHELTHAVTQYTCGLDYSYQSGALNESYSDVFGEMAERSVRANDWQMGEDVFTPGRPGDALRSMSNPPQYGQPDNMSNYVYTDADNGGVHTNSGIPNKAAYNIAQAVGSDKMQQIYYRVLTVYLTSSSQFADARDASVQAATDLYGGAGPEVAAVQNGFSAVGIGSSAPSSMMARVEIQHPYRGDLVVTVGTGNPDSPTWQTVVSNRQGGAAQNIYANVDISGGASQLPPNWQQRWWLKVYDGAAQDEGSISKFSITDNGTTYTATDTPIPVTDYHTSISWIPSSDTTPPTVTATSPANAAAMVYTTSDISATFSEPINPATLSTSSFTVSRHSDGTAVAGGVSFDQATNRAIFDPAANLDARTQYDARLTTAITDAAGNPLQQEYIWSFTTGDPPLDSWFTWYDMATPGMSDWIVMGNPDQSSNAAGFDVQIAGQKKNASPMLVQPGQTLPVTYPGTMGGPVEVASLGGTPQVISQRTLFGNSFEEINAIESSRLTGHYYFSWYDGQSNGSQNWVMIANPFGNTVEADIYIAGRKMNSTPYVIAPGQNINPQFPGVMAGPVEVIAYQPGNPSVPMPVIASQRVIWQGNFNEVEGIPASELSDDYLFTWYDQKSAGATDWVLVSNPSASQDMYAEVWIGGQRMNDSATGEPYFFVPAGDTIKPTFDKVIAGPVEVKGYTAGSYSPSNQGAPNMNFFTTQRVLFGSSFEEVNGIPVSSLSSDYFFSWYDEQSRGSTDWVLVANPTASQAIAEIWIGGNRVATETVPPGSSIAPQFSGMMSGPVEVRGYDALTYNPVLPGTPNHNLFTSQRVLWNGHFNEVTGMQLK